MRRRPSLLLLCLGLAACTTSTAAPPPPSSAAVTAPAAPRGSASAVAEAPEAPSPAKTLREATLRTSVALDTVKSLVDAASPRLSGSPGGKAALGWAPRAMESAGLAKVHTEPVKVPHWERGEESGEILAPHAHKLALAALGGSVGTPAAGLEAEVIEVDSLDALEKLDAKDVKGKIVFFHVIMERLKDGSGYGKAVRVRGIGAIAAAKLGAVGVVIRSIGTDMNRAPHTGAMRYDAKVEKIPAAALAIPDADLLHRLVALSTPSKPVRLKFKLGARSFPDADSANVIGDVVGSSLPDEVVLLAAHLDSWDLGQGALDDGAGCGIILEVGRQLALMNPKPKRTVRVVFFANEENGLEGAKAYAKAHEAEVAKHVLAFEADFGAARVVEARFSGGEDKRPQFLAIAALLAPLGVAMSTEPAEGGADISTLQALGVPMLDLRQDGTTYFDFHHTANDTVERIEKAEIDQAAAAFAAAAYSAADAPSDFGRLPDERRDHRH